MYDELPFPLIHKIYIFNITNPDEVHTGGKPNLQEIGPYVFQLVTNYLLVEFSWLMFSCSLHKTRVDQIDDVDADTLEYTLFNTYYYHPELSDGLTGNEIITTAHPCTFSASR